MFYVISLLLLFNLIMQKGSTLKKCNINLFKLKEKAVIAMGQCQIMESGSGITLKSKESVFQIPKGKPLIRLRELHYCTYLVPKENQTVYTVSLPGNDSECIAIFQSMVLQSMEIQDFYSLPGDSEIKKQIAINCPLGSSAQQLGSNNSDNLNSAGKALGNAFGSVSALFQFDQLNKDTRDTVNRIQQNNLGTGQSSGWGRFKAKCSIFNKKVAEGLKPVSNTAKQTVSNIGHKFDTSENSFIKNIREWSAKTQNSLNQGYIQAETVGTKRKSMNVQSQNQSTQLNSQTAQYSRNSAL